MKLKFIGGPWDGVEFEAPIAPDYIRLQSLVEEQSLPDQQDASEPEEPEELADSDDADSDGVPRPFVSDKPEEFPQPVARAYERQKDAGDVPVVVYTFSAGLLPWWEQMELPPE